MDEVFRLKKSIRNVGLACLPCFLAWGSLMLWVGLDAPHAPNRLLLAVGLAGVPFGMAGLSVYVLVAYRKETLTIREDRVTFRGVFGRKEIDLDAVTRVRWFVLGDRIVLRTDSAQLSIFLGNYEPEDRSRIIAHLRTVLRPEVQDGWNLFAYREEQRAERSNRTKPGPDEVLIRRDRYDRHLVSSLVLAGLSGVVVWRITGNPGSLALILVPLFPWALLRASTPAEGMVATKLSASRNRDAVRSAGVMLLWGLVGIAGIAVNEYYRPKLTEPDAILIVGAVAWLVVLFFEGFRLDRLQSARDREAADLAAKHRGEPTADPWRVE